MIEVYTFKERGLLSPVAHDLCLATDDVTVRGEGDRVEVTVPVASLRVRGKVVFGRVEPMSPGDCRDIERTVRETILRAPTVRFDGTLEGDVAAGRLRMASGEQPVRVPFTRAGDRVRGELDIAPSRWGIQPYKALLGALRLQDRVIIRFDLPLPGSG